jgi:hypothetical protein
MGKIIDGKIHLTPGARVGGTDYRELIHVDCSFIGMQEGYIAPSGNGTYFVRRPSRDSMGHKQGDGEDYHLHIEF